MRLEVCDSLWKFYRNLAKSLIIRPVSIIYSSRQFRNLFHGFPLQLDGRKDQLQSTWEDVTKMVKKAEVHKDDLKERTDSEILRSGQPLCIYELYDGKGTWPFLHDENTLYRGLSLVSDLF